MYDINSIIAFAHEIIEMNGINLSELYSKDLKEHSENVAKLAVALGLEYGEDLQSLLNLGVGGLLHDFGKVTIDDSLLQKPDRLTNMESYLIQGHPEKGYRDLKKYNFSPEVFNIIKMHHEKLNGSGYPTGTHDIPIYVQLITIADIYDALRSERPYKDKKSINESITILKNSHSALNQITVHILEQMIKEKKYGF